MYSLGTKVEIEKKVNYSDLERALLIAAGELGWKAEVQHKFERKSVLGSIKGSQEYHEYLGTRIKLRGRFF